MAMTNSFKFLITAVAMAVLNFAGMNPVFSADLETTSFVIPSFTLNTGKKIPSIGYGTYQAKNDELEKALDIALEAGYRHIDTAFVYENEKPIGNVLKRWFRDGKLKREDIFLVTKLPIGANRPSDVSKFLNKSLENLQVDYVDLYLIHAPFSFKGTEVNLYPRTADGSIELDNSVDHLEVWKEMEKQMNAGLTKAIGLSNFNKTQVERILNNCKITPSSLQVELHVYLQQNKLVDLCKKNNIIVTAYSPLGSPGRGAYNRKNGKKNALPDVLGNPKVTSIAKKHSKTPAQVVLRYDIQRGIIPIPKSTNAARLKQNIDIFDFELDEQDMRDLKGLDSGVRILDFLEFKGIANHPEYPFRSELNHHEK